MSYFDRLHEHHGQFLDRHVELFCRAVLFGNFYLAAVAHTNLWIVAGLFVEAVEAARP
jgi:hypothetical protein